MSEKAEPDAWYAPRLSPMIAFGWDEQELTGFVLQDDHRINERLEWLERALFDANRSQERLQRLTGWLPLSDESVATVSDLLNQPLNAIDARTHMDEMTELDAPWEAPLERAKSRWETEGLVEEWLNLHRALRTTDVSSLGAIALIQPLFDTPDRISEIWEHVHAVRRDEERQQRLMHEAADALRTAGFEVPKLDGHALMDALVILENWQSLHHDVEAAILNAQQLIGPFDNDESTRLVTALRGVVHVDHKKRLNGLSRDIQDVGQRLENRRRDLSETLNIWRRQGVVFPIAGAIKPGELHEWESNMENITTTVEQHLVLMETAKRFQQTWPFSSEQLSPLVGQLDQTEALHLAIESLEQQWTALELDGFALMEPYLRRGMQMDVWNTRLLNEPKSTVDLMLARQDHWNRQIALIERLESLDVSVEGLDDQQHRLELLRLSTIEADVLDEMESYVKLKERRQLRHRTMLDDALGKLRILNGAIVEINTNNLSLAAFETHVAAMQRTGGKGEGRPLANRAKEGLKRELGRLQALGWDTSTWDTMMVQRPSEIALQLNKARPHIQSIDKLRGRIMALPWNRDVEMALGIQFQIQQPEMLDQMANSVSVWLSHLAQRPVEQHDFELNLWRPIVPEHSRRDVDFLREEAEDPVFDRSFSDESRRESTHPKKDGPVLVEEREETAPVSSQPYTDELETAPLRSHEEVVANSEPVTLTEERQEPPLESSTSPLNPPLLPNEPLDETPLAAEPKMNDRHEPISAKKTALPLSEHDSNLATRDETHDALSALSSVLVGLDLPDLASAIGARGLEGVNPVRREMARHVNRTPRDVRVARLLRLVLRLLPDGNEDDAGKSKLLLQLSEGIPELKRWTRRRLEARHQGASGNMLDDALALGVALQRIPGLGQPVPLTKDTWPLPMDLVGLQREVAAWSKAARPPAAGGVRG